MSRLLRSACHTSRSWNSRMYHLKENPPHTLANRDALKELTTRTPIGR